MKHLVKCKVNWPQGLYIYIFMMSIADSFSIYVKLLSPQVLFDFILVYVAAYLWLFFMEQLANFCIYSA